jgi:hypothetical protein
MANLQHSNQNIEDEDRKNEIIQADFSHEKAKHVKRMKIAGVVPGSDKYLNHDDAEGNQLFRLTCMKDMTTDYIRLLKKNGF